MQIPLGDLPEDARAWERGVDELAEEDEDIAEYVRALEETRDTAELPEASGEAIAREFERYLKRRGDDAGLRARLRARGPGRASSTGARPHAASRSEVVGERRSLPSVASRPGLDRGDARRGVEVVGQRGEHRLDDGRRPGRRRRGTSARRQAASVSTASQSRSSVHSQSLR